MKAKAKGSAWERDIIHVLEYEGCACTRAAGSMGMWDIIAFNGDSILLIQAKCNSLRSLEERRLLAAFQAPPNCVKQIWRKDDRKPAPVIYTPLSDGTWALHEAATRSWQSAMKEYRKSR